METLILGALSSLKYFANKYSDTILAKTEMQCKTETIVNKDKCNAEIIIASALCSTILGTAMIFKSQKKQEKATETDKNHDNSKIVELKGVA